MRTYSINSFLFPACVFFVTCFQVIVLIVSYTLLLCSSSLCANFTGSKIGLVIYIKHLGEIAPAAQFDLPFLFLFFSAISYLSKDWLCSFYFWHSMANLHYLMTIFLFFHYPHRHSNLQRSCSTMQQLTVF